MNINSILLADGYKLGHVKQYPPNTTMVFSNFTPRGDKYANKQLKGNGVVVFGVQMVFQKLNEHFNENFFMTKERAKLEKCDGYAKPYANYELSKLKESVINPIKEELTTYLGTEYDSTHFEELWDLGYLPIEVRSLTEGTICPIKVPLLTVHNTLPQFFWVTNFIETILSTLLWKPITSATIARGYRNILDSAALATTGSTEGVQWQGHDFSMRGVDSVDAVVSSGLGHLTSFTGTDSLPTIWGARKYYDETGFICGSIPATEHSVACSYFNPDDNTDSSATTNSDLNYFKRLLEIYPTGLFSAVSDTYDLWAVLTEVLPQLKDQIMNREGRVVIRPDSGCPVDIICGNALSVQLEDLNDVPQAVIDTVGENGVVYNCNDNKYYRITYNKDGDGVVATETTEITYENKGVVEILWEVFGGTVNEQGYKVLDTHIGVIYGDSITLDRAEMICNRLAAKGFASTNVVFGVGLAYNGPVTWKQVA